MNVYVNNTPATVKFAGMPAVGVLGCEGNVAALDALLGSVLKKYNGRNVPANPTTAALVASLTVNISADTKSADGTHTLTVTGLGAKVGQNVTIAGATPSALNGTYSVVSAADANTIQIVSSSAVRTSGGTAAIAAIRADQLVSGMVVRTGPTAAYADTMDSAAQILALISGARVGMEWPVTFQNGVAYANTIAAGTGVTFVGSNVIAASAVVEFILTVTGVDTPAVTLNPVEAGTA
jgi:hypothetical protein